MEGELGACEGLGLAAERAGDRPCLGPAFGPAEPWPRGPLSGPSPRPRQEPSGNAFTTSGGPIEVAIDPFSGEKAFDKAAQQVALETCEPLKHGLESIDRDKLSSHTPFRFREPGQ